MNMTRRSFLGACLAAIGVGWELLHGRIPQKKQRESEYLYQKLVQRAEERLSLIHSRPMSLCEVSPYWQADSSSDWQPVRLIKDSAGEYAWDPPSTLWGKPAVVTDAVSPTETWPLISRRQGVRLNIEELHS